MPAAQREVIHPEHLHRSDWRDGRRTQQAQQGVATDRHTQRPGKPSTRTPGQRDRDRTQRVAQRRAVPGVRGSQSRDLLGERATATAGLSAGEPAYQQPDHHRGTTQWSVGQAAPVAAVHPRRHRAAVGAGHRHSRRPDLDHHPVDAAGDPVDHDTTQMRQQPNKSMIIAP